jgi:8-oxo-dGTP pyrophosphatase MutT (NUDIX family)
VKPQPRVRTRSVGIPVASHAGSVRVGGVETKHRPAARIVCLDAADRLLLLHWQDPSDGSRLWEPPGGGIDPGETPLQTARRELVEETGLDAAAVLDRWVPVERSVRWNGTLFAGEEQFFLARFGTERPALVRTGLLPDEQVNLHDHVWVTPAELAALTKLPDRLEPPQLPSVVAALAPDSSWAAVVG